MIDLDFERPSRRAPGLDMSECAECSTWYWYDHDCKARWYPCPSCGATVEAGSECPRCGA